MAECYRTVTRRRFIHTASLTASFLIVPGAFAEELMCPTAWVTEGPFYPTKLPLDRDNDLLIVSDAITPAVGEITHLSGRLLDRRGNPIRSAEIQIWQVDHNGVYLEERASREDFDPNFQGFGGFVTGSKGEYYFRTIKPIVYPGRRAPHIHFKVITKGREAWTTQLYVKDYPDNGRDGIYRNIGDDQVRETVTKKFVPIKESRIGELAVRFDIVMDYSAQA